MQLNTPDMTAIVSKAILDSLDAQKRDLLIQEALRGLMEPPKGSYSSNKSVLQEMFAKEAANVASEVIREKLQNDPVVKAKLESMVSEVVAVVVAEDSKLRSVVRESIEKAFRGY